MKLDESTVEKAALSWFRDLQYSNATERQVRLDLAALKVLGLADSRGHGRGAKWSLT